MQKKNLEYVDDLLESTEFLCDICDLQWKIGTFRERGLEAGTGAANQGLRTVLAFFRATSTHELTEK